MVALFGEPSPVADGWLENRAADTVFAAPADGLPLEQTLPIDQVSARIPLLPLDPLQVSSSGDAAGGNGSSDDAAIRLHASTNAAPLAALQRLAHRLPQVLPHDCLAALADRCLDQERPDLALPLLDALSADPARRLAAAQCRLGLGQAVGARQALDLLIGDPALQDDPALAADTLDTYAWVLLREGNVEALPQLIERLGSLPDCLARVDRLARVLSTIHWIDTTAAEAIGHSRDLRPMGGPAIALDSVQMSSCGAVALLGGWLLDPGESIDTLVLVRGKRAQRLSLANGRRLARADLAELLAESDLPADSPVGFQLWAIDGVEEAHPPQADAWATLFVITSSGEQCCLAQPIELIDFREAALQTFCPPAD